MLQNLDFPSVAENHLCKTLLRSKAISAAPALPRNVQIVAESARRPENMASVNVQARLFKTGPVIIAMGEILENVRVALGLQDLKLGGKKRLRARDYNSMATQKNCATGITMDDIPVNEEQGGTALEDVSHSKERKPSTASEAHSATDGPENGAAQQAKPFAEETGTDIARKDESPTESPEVADDSSSSADSKSSADRHTDHSEIEDYDTYTKRLAPSTDDKSTGSQMDEVHRPALLDANPSNREIIEEGSSSEELSPKKTSKNNVATTPRSTTFLPSLSMGGYCSGSEMDSDEENAANIIPPRKNRRGQQARRAIWEKKFGVKAKHLQKQPQGRDQGWDARRGASAGDGRGMRGRIRGHTGSGRMNSTRGSAQIGREPAVASSGANSEPLKVKAKQNVERLLHPSWEAAKKAKEQKATAAFQGKKVVFD